MSSLTAGKIQADTLNVAGLGAGAIKTRNLNFTNLDVSGNLTVQGAAVATQAFVSSAVSGVIGSAGAALDTLGEIQAALGNDANLATTLTNSIATKANASDVTAGLALKANASDVTAGLALKANAADLTSGLALKANAADLTSGLALKANLAGPTFTGVPAAPTAVVGTNTTQLATTAFVNSSVNTFKNVVNSLTGKTYCLYVIDTMIMNTAANVGPQGLACTLRFNKEQTVTITSYVQNFTNNQFGPLSTEYSPSYTIVSEPTSSTGAVISFRTTGAGYGFVPYFRLLTLTFDVDYVKILTSVESIEAFTLKTTADTIANAVVTPTSQSDFLSKFLVAYTANLGNSLYQVDASGNFTADASGTRVNMGSIYTTAGSDWRKQVAIRLMSTNADVLLTENTLSRLQLATKFYENELLVGFSDETVGYCGIKLDVEYDSSMVIPEDDIYNIPISIYNSNKRLTGVSDGKFEPNTDTFLGKNCAWYEKVDASGSAPARLRHITVRGLDVIAHNHRMHFDLSKMNYLKGRSLSYCRHKESFLNDTYWYPNGPEFRINLNPEFTVTKMIVNDSEIPLHLIKRRSWDNVTKDFRAITFNIADAVSQVSGFVFKYDTDSLGNYTEAGLNKVEIWYQGKYNKNNGFLAANIQPLVTTNHLMVPSSKNTNMSTLMKNPRLYDQVKVIGAKYGIPVQPEYIYPYVGQSGGYLDLVELTTNIPMMSSTMVSSGMDYYPYDTTEIHLFMLVPSNDNSYDKFYHQIEIMCPRQFYPSTGGTRLSAIESADKNNVLYRFVPGVKAVGDDYRSTYSTALSFRIKGYPTTSESISVSDGNNGTRSIPYYAEIPAEMKPFYNLSSTSYNATNIQRIIQSIETIMGPYPFDTYGTGITNSAAGGAMEHMEMSSYGATALGWTIVVHEAFHQWWQNTISFETNKDWWIDEGLTWMSQFWVLDDLNLDASSNSFYRFIVKNKVNEVENGWNPNPLGGRFQVYTGGYGSYDHASYPHTTMYLNMGADFKVENGNFVVKPIDASGNIAMNILDASGVVTGSGLLNPDTRQLIVDTSGTLRYVNAANKVVDASGVLVGTTNVVYMLGYLDSSGVLLDASGAPIVVLGQTLSDGLKLPSGPKTEYYIKGSSNVNFWNCMKFILNRFKGSIYNYSNFRTALGDFVEANKSDWGNKWPSTRGEAVELFDQMVNQGANKPLGGDFYTITIDPALLPVGTITNPTPIASKLTVNDLVYQFAYCSTSFATSQALIDITLPLAHLQDSSGNALLGQPEDFVGKDFTGKILLIKRGTVTFANKISRGQVAGAAAVIIYNNVAGLNVASLGSTPFKVTVPCMTLSQADANTFIAQLASNPGLTARIQGKFRLKL
jgi:hypothetical protein